MSDTMEKLNAVFQEVFENDDMIITGTTTAADVEGWDSLMHVTFDLSARDLFNSSVEDPWKTRILYTADRASH
jgi:acyl carrier protein